VDRYGIPVLRFRWKWGESEILQAKHMQETFREIIQQMGGEPYGTMPDREHDYGLEAGGRIIHEAGCTRMGADPKTSAFAGSIRKRASAFATATCASTRRSR
jgi:hypothetical protein